MMNFRLFVCLMSLLVPALSVLGEDKIAIPDPERKDGAGLQAGAKLNLFLAQNGDVPSAPAGEGPGMMFDANTSFNAANFAKSANLRDYINQEGIKVSRWNGYLKVTEPGTYYFTFAVNGSNASWSGGMLLEGEVLFENIYQKKKSPPGQAVELKPGFYKVAVWISPNWGGGNLHFYGGSSIDLRVRKPGAEAAESLSPAKLLREK